MAAKDKCNTCDHWEQQGSDPDFGACRRYPQQCQGKSEERIKAGRCFPLVYGQADCCGDYTKS